MSKVKYYGKNLLLEVEHDTIVYDCVVSSDCKNLYECEPTPNSWVEIENVIRDAAWNLKIENLDGLG